MFVCIYRQSYICPATIVLLFHVVNGPSSLGSSVNTVSGYGLDDRAISFRFPAEAKGFSSNLCVQTSSGVHPASCLMGVGGPFRGVKLGRGVKLTTHPHILPWMSRNYTSSAPLRIYRFVAGLLYPFFNCPNKVYVVYRCYIKPNFRTIYYVTRRLRISEVRITLSFSLWTLRH
jgi:hypothetical protein